MRLQFFFKTTVLFGASRTLQSFEFSFPSYFHNSFFGSRAAQNIFQLSKIFNPHKDGRFCWISTQFGEFGLRSSKGYLSLFLTPFYNKSNCFQVPFYRFDKGMFALQVLKRLSDVWANNNQPSNLGKTLIQHISTNTKQFGNDHCLPLEKSSYAIWKVVPNGLSNPVALYALQYKNFLVAQLKMVSQSFAVESISFVEGLKDNMNDEMNMALQAYYKNLKNDTYRLQLIKSYQDFIDKSEYFEMFCLQKHSMHALFFENEQEFVQSQLRHRVKAFDEQYQDLLDIKKNDIDALNQLKETMDQLKGFVYGACDIIDDVNAEISCLRAKMAEREIFQRKIKPIVQYAHTALSHEAYQSAISKNYRSCLSKSFSRVPNISNSVYLNALNQSKQKFIEIMKK